MRRIIRWGLWVTAALLAGCSEQAADQQTQFSSRPSDGGRAYVVGIHPLHNPMRLLEIYGPIIKHIEANIPGAQFRIEASRNYEEFEKKLFGGYFDFAMPNPYQTVRSLNHGYRVFGKMGDDADFRGIILVRKDSGIHTLIDLKGKKVAYPAATALAATMMPQYYLHTHGIDVNRDIENLYVGSQESSIMNVLRGHVAAAATWPIPWKAFASENPELAAQLEVKWQTGTLPNNGWVVRKDIPEALSTQFAAQLFNLDKNAQGREMPARLPISKFEPASDATYRPVIEYLRIFRNYVAAAQSPNLQRT